MFNYLFIYIKAYKKMYVFWVFLLLVHSMIHLFCHHCLISCLFIILIKSSFFISQNNNKRLDVVVVILANNCLGQDKDHQGFKVMNCLCLCLFLFLHFALWLQFVCIFMFCCLVTNLFGLTNFSNWQCYFLINN